MQWVWNPWRVYLWPTPFGWGYGLLLIALFLLAANYQLSLAYLTLFFAAAFAAAAAVHTVRLPTGVTLTVRGTESRGGTRHLLLTWQAPTSAQEGALLVASRDPQTGNISSHLLVLAEGHGQLTLPFSSGDDRFAEPPVLLLTTTLPWGLVRTWALWQPALVTPPPELGDTPGQPVQVAALADREQTAAASSAAPPGIDWHGWRPAQTGEFARRPNRQQLARRDEVWLSDREPFAANALNQLRAPTPRLHRPAPPLPSVPPATSWLFLAAAGAFAALPHFPATPTPWIALVVLLIGATLLIHLRRHQPPRWLAPFVGLALIALIRPIFGYGIGQETALALLAAAAWLKGWEAHTPRDLRAWGLTLAFFLTAAFLRDQRPLTALIVALGWGLLLIGWAEVTRAEWRLPARPGLTAALGRQLVATGTMLLPLVVLLFLLVPRLEQPLWGIPYDAARGKTGLSKELTPGAISALAQSDEVALSLTWVEAPPPPAQLYLRAVVLTDYDGTRWHPWQAAQPNTTTPSPSSTTEQPAGRAFTLLLTPQPIPWLPLPEHTVTLTGSRPVTALPDGRWQVATPLIERTLWQGSAQLSERWPQPLTPDERARLTHLPADVEPRAQALGRAIAARHRDPSERLAAIAAAFQAAELRYTLNPPTMPNHPADTTLFDLRTGFCEHFAHAFAVVARAAGLPTRIVTGYQGATYNPTDGSWVVRHADAHAWAEVWIAGDWLRVDPTRWASPERLDRGSTAALRDELPTWRALWFDSPLLSSVRQQLWAWQRRWDLWVVGFDAARQRQLWQHLGWDEGFVPQALILLAVTAASLALLVFLPLSSRRRDRVTAAWEAVLLQLASLGVTRAPHEPLLPFAHQLEMRLPTPLAREVEAALRQLIAYRYGPQGEAPAPQTLIQALRQLRWRLTCYRWSRFLPRSSS